MENYYYFLPVKDLNLPEPSVQHTVVKTDAGFDIHLETDKLAKNIYLQTGDEQGFFSDNYFDLLPGDKKTVSLTTDLTEERLAEVLTVRTLDDAF